ncbi:MAG: hypothetical protein AAF633_24970, partial [Chloroflexota bacterium]
MKVRLFFLSLAVCLLAMIDELQAAQAQLCELSVEAEGGAIFNGFELRDVGVVAIGSDRYELNADDRIEYMVCAPSAGEYQLAGWFDGPDDESDSFYVGINGDIQQWNVRGEGFATKEYLSSQGADDPINSGTPTTFSLNEGVNSFNLYKREAGAAADRFVFEPVSPPAAEPPTETPAPTGTAEPTATDMPTATATQPIPTATATEPAPAATATGIPTEMPAATATRGTDLYEPDSEDEPVPYGGTTRRCFYPQGDVDYFVYNAKAGVTEIETINLQGGVDTYLEIFAGERLIALDDDSGEGLAAVVVLSLNEDTQIQIHVSNKAVAFGDDACYQLRITAQADQIQPTRDTNLDRYEPDEDEPSVWSGKQPRCFFPEGDRDYIRV